KKQKSKTSFTGAFDFLVQKGLMGQPLLKLPYPLLYVNLEKVFLLKFCKID
ncbi:hypothetical protein W341_02484, partial [Staphylococcus aureus DAR5832]